jgi:TRAP-type C4-dicarboxylate transport system permease small subunit
MTPQRGTGVRGVLYRLEDTVLVGLLLLIIGVAVSQIVLRNLFDTGIIWGDVLIRIMVLWVGLFGAMIASRRNKHISIDLVARFLPERFQNMVNCVVGLFTAVTCGVMAYYSLRFVRMEFEAGGAAFSQIPIWICVAIIPFAFGVMAFRYIVLTTVNLSKLIRSSL